MAEVILFAVIVVITVDRRIAMAILIDFYFGKIQYYNFLHQYMLFFTENFCFFSDYLIFILV
jgi:hypothetical protein